jgi:hypothetical protein
MAREKYLLPLCLTAFCLWSNASEVVVQEILMGTDCNIKIKDPYEGKASSGMVFRGGYEKVPAPNGSSLGRLALTWECLDKDDEVVNSGWAQYLPRQNTWRPRHDEKPLNTRKQEKVEFSLLQNANSRGWVATVKQRTGKEKFREKTIYFCLVHSAKAVCGYGTVGLVREGLEGDLTTYAERIIQSIEFLP